MTCGICDEPLDGPYEPGLNGKRVHRRCMAERFHQEGAA